MIATIGNNMKRPVELIGRETEKIEIFQLLCKCLLGDCKMIAISHQLRYESRRISRDINSVLFYSCKINSNSKLLHSPMSLSNSTSLLINNRQLSAGLNPTIKKPQVEESLR